MSKAKALGTGLENRVVEKATKAGLKAAKQPLSGALAAYPGDVVLGDGLVECKVRTAQIDAKGQRYIRLDLDWLKKVQSEADRSGQAWAVVVVNAKSSQKPLVLCDLDHLLVLMKS